MCYEEIHYLRCHFTKNYAKALSRNLIKYVGEVSFQTMLKGTMNEDAHSIAVPVIQFTRYTLFVCFRVLFRGLFLL